MISMRLFGAGHGHSNFSSHSIVFLLYMKSSTLLEQILEKVSVEKKKQKKKKQKDSHN